jgi:hypothetical protein
MREEGHQIAHALYLSYGVQQGSSHRPLIGKRRQRFWCSDRSLRILEQLLSKMSMEEKSYAHPNWEISGNLC